MQNQTKQNNRRGKKQKQNRVHAFHHAICEALFNVSLSLQHDSSLRISSSSSQKLSSSTSSALPHGFLSFSSADTIPSVSAAISRKEQRLKGLTSKRAKTTTCVCVYVFPPTFKCNANPIHF